MDELTDKGAAIRFGLPLKRPLSKFPRFWHTDPEVWFVQLKAFFKINDIFSDQDMFTVLVANLDRSILPYIADIVLDPPAQHQMKAVKERIMIVFGKTEEIKLRELLRELLPVVERPSQLLMAMKMMCRKESNQELIKSLFLDRVNPVFRSNFNIKQSIEEIATAADYIVDIQDPFMGTFWYSFSASTKRSQLQTKDLLSSLARKA